jgi:hypothetical protein
MMNRNKTRSLLCAFTCIAASACASAEEDDSATDWHSVGGAGGKLDSGTLLELDGGCTSTECALPTSCDADQDCPQGYVCDEAASACVPGGECGMEELELTRQVPNLFIALDRSCSMNSGQPVSKWNSATAALNLASQKFAGKVRWGLTLFPDKIPDKKGNSCSQESEALLCADGNESLLVQKLADPLNQPTGPCDTPINAAVREMQESLVPDPAHPSYGLLLTDGKQDACGEAAGVEEARQMLANMNALGIKTFVVGFGQGVDANQLTLLAQAGGMVNSAGAAAYYQADSPADLDAALLGISGAVASCQFQLQETPPDPGALFVFLNDQKVQNDETNGWEYDASTNSVIFHGAACENLKQQPDVDIDVVFGCDAPTPK